MQLDPAQLAALSAILRYGAFDAAAAALHVTPSAISQRLKALEDKVGTTLVIRATPCVPTEAGARLARHADELSLLEADLARDLSLPGEPGQVRLAINADSLGTFALKALAEIPTLRYDVVLDDQAHSAEWLRRGEVSAAICDFAQPVQGCDCLPLGILRYIATASPGFMARHFCKGATPDALAQAPALRFNAKDRLQHDWLRQITQQKMSPPCHHMPSTQDFVTAAKLGLGWGMNPEGLVQSALDDGSLCEVLDNHPLDVPLYWQVRRAVGPALRPLTDALLRAARAELRGN